MFSRSLATAGLLVFALLLPAPAWAAVDPEVAYVFNSFAFLIHGVLVMFMAAGFAMLEAGLVRTKNTAAICLKNISLYALAGLAFYLIGYNLLYLNVPEGGFIGQFKIFANPSSAELALIASGGEGATALSETLEQGYSSMSDWFFQMVFVATTASIVSGTLAERIRIAPFLIFVLVLSALIYPVQAAWSWGGGWLTSLGFSDFAGSTIVHSVGGWAALMGALVLGPRKGKYDSQGRVLPLPGANLPLATLGTFILWMGWFGFNGGSQLALGSALDVSAMALVYANTNLAAAGGVIAAMAATYWLYRKLDLTMALNGALAGLVSITAGPNIAEPGLAVVIGVIGGVLAVLAVPLLDRLKIDDVVGAIPVHLVAGIWGTLAVAIFNGGDLIAQLTGIAAVAVFVSLASLLVWFVLAKTMGLRVGEEEELMGLDKAELGLEAYPEFGRGSQLF